MSTPNKKMKLSLDTSTIMFAINNNNINDVKKLITPDVITELLHKSITSESVSDDMITYLLEYYINHTENIDLYDLYLLAIEHKKPQLIKIFNQCQEKYNKHSLNLISESDKIIKELNSKIEELEDTIEVLNDDIQREKSYQRAYLNTIRY